MKALVILALCASPLLAWANPALETIEQRLSRPALDSGQFEQVRELQDLPWPLRSSGEFAHLRDNGLIWRIQHPIFTEMRIRGERIEQRDSSDSPWAAPALGEQGQKLTAQLLASLLDADIALLKTHFSLAAQSDESGWRLELSPINAVMAQWLQGAVVQGNQVVESINIRFASGENMRIKLLRDPQSKVSDSLLNALQEQT